MKWIAVTSLATLLAACAASPPEHFYSLAPVVPRSPGQAAATVRAPVRVGAVHIPPALDREEIVRRGPGNRLEVSGLDRWGAPLDQTIQRVLTEDLIERLPAGKVVLPGGPAPAGTDRIVVDILQFQSDVAGTVVFEGSWSLVAPGASAPSLIRDFRSSGTASPTDYGDQARAMSDLLGGLADDIARSLAGR